MRESERGVSPLPRKPKAPEGRRLPSVFASKVRRRYPCARTDKRGASSDSYEKSLSIRDRR